jgi:hypothetical protein
VTNDSSQRETIVSVSTRRRATRSVETVVVEEDNNKDNDSDDDSDDDNDDNDDSNDDINHDSNNSDNDQQPKKQIKSSNLIVSKPSTNTINRKPALPRQPLVKPFNAQFYTTASPLTIELDKKSSSQQTHLCILQDINPLKQTEDISFNFNIPSLVSPNCFDFFVQQAISATKQDERNIDTPPFLSPTTTNSTPIGPTNNLPQATPAQHCFITISQVIDNLDHYYW